MRSLIRFPIPSCGIRGGGFSSIVSHSRLLCQAGRGFPLMEYQHTLGDWLCQVIGRAHRRSHALVVGVVAAALSRTRAAAHAPVGRPSRLESRFGIRGKEKKHGPLSFWLTSDHKYLGRYRSSHVGCVPRTGNKYPLPSSESFAYANWSFRAVLLLRNTVVHYSLSRVLTTAGRSGG